MRFYIAFAKAGEMSFIQSMKPHISTITLGVSNLTRAVAFYRDGLGLKLQSESPGAASFALRGAHLLLVAREEMVKDTGVFDLGVAGSFGGFMLEHGVETQPEVEAILNAARGAGANIIKPATDTASGGTHGFFADPDGFVWEIAWEPNWKQ